MSRESTQPGQTPYRLTQWEQGIWAPPGLHSVLDREVQQENLGHENSPEAVGAHRTSVYVIGSHAYTLQFLDSPSLPVLCGRPLPGKCFLGSADLITSPRVPALTLFALRSLRGKSS